ncbi:hypothetical protein FRC12_023537 [Ceratobasidium sp. 428]|nr:hypothetical protein FRC12_023537 [Ceratobasidium sp. 428]
MEAGLSIESALDEWKAMRAQLSDSIESYLSACKTLGAICTRDYRTRAGSTMAEQAFTQLDAELESLAAEEGALRATRFSLSTLRNKSGTLAPINLLPVEILIRIFTLSTISNCRHYNHDAVPYNFTTACVRWRRITLDTSHFWTHIDIGPGVPWELSRLMLDQATGHGPLHLHIHENELPTPGEQTRYIQYFPLGLMRKLKPYIHRVYGLELSSRKYLDGCFAARMAEFWFEHGDKDLVRSLSIHQRTHNNEVLFDEPEENTSVLNTSGRGKEILLSLRVLQLHGARFNWNSNAYRGLIDLRLGFVSKSRISSVSSSELARVLMASPMLAVLKLKGLKVTCAEDLMQNILVPLNRLHVLNLTEMSSESLKQILPLIFLPKASSTELRIGLGVCDALENELYNFFAQSSITTLYCICKPSSFGAWSSILSSVRSLHTLVLDMEGCHLKDHISSLPDDTVSQLTVAGSCPFSLVLRRCLPAYEDLSGLAFKLGVQELRIQDPVLPEDFGITPSAEEYWESIRTSLMQAYPNLRYALEQRDSFGNLYQDISPGCWP